MTTVRELVTRLGFKVDTQSLSKWERRIDGAKRAMAKARKSAQEFGAAVAKVAIGVGAAATAIGGLVKKVADVGDQAAKDARKLGLTAEAVQEIGYAARLSGSDVGTMKTGLQALARGLNDATTKGTGPAAEAFEQLGLSLNNPAVKSNDLNEVMNLVADRFEQMPDGAKKTALAMKLFSRSGAELIPLLNSGSRGIESMRREARELGLVMSNEAAAESERFNDDLERTKSSLFGVAMEIATNLMPTIRQWMNDLRAWIGENKVLLEQKVRGFIFGMVEAAQALVPVIVSGVEALGDLIERLGGADKALYAAAAGLVAMKLATLAATNPWLALAAAITAAGAALGDFLVKSKLQVGVGGALSQAQSKIIESHEKQIKDGQEKADGIQKRFDQAKVEGFAPELLRDDGGKPVRSENADIVEAYISNKIGATAKAQARKAKNSGASFSDAESFARRELESRRLLAREAASRAILSGKSDREIRRAIDSALSGKPGGVGGGRGKGRGKSRKAPEQDGKPKLSVDEMLERDFGAGLGTTVQGTKVRPSLGTTINKITNEYKPQVTQHYAVVQRGGESSSDFVQRVAETVDRRIGEVFSRGYQHFKGATSA